MCSPGLSELAGSTVASKGPLDAKLACPPGLLGLPGPQYCLPGPQYCHSWPPGLPQRLLKDCQNGCQWQRTSYVRSKQLPIPTELLVHCTFVAGWRHMQH